MWTNVLIVAHVITALAIIGLVLLQHGKGAGHGLGFGGGASRQPVRRHRLGEFPLAHTAVLATLFSCSAWRSLTSQRTAGRAGGGVMDAVKKPNLRRTSPKRPANRRSRNRRAAGETGAASDSQRWKSGDNQGLRPTW